MKITKIETILAGVRYLFVKVHTDAGLVGLGECGAWCYQEATAEAIHAMEHHLIGLDPMQIEYINNGLSRCMHFRGSVVAAAISGIDIALWDLKGKYFGVPIYELLGGKVRDKARIYVNFKANTPDEFAKKALELKNQGYTAIRYSMGHPRIKQDAAASPIPRSFSVWRSSWLPSVKPLAGIWILPLNATEACARQKLLNAEKFCQNIILTFMKTLFRIIYPL